MDIARQLMGEIDHEMYGDASDPDEEEVMVDNTSAPTSVPPLKEVRLDKGGGQRNEQRTLCSTLANIIPIVASIIFAFFPHLSLRSPPPPPPPPPIPCSSPSMQILMDRHWTFEEVLWIKGSSTNMSRVELQETVADAKGVEMDR